MASKSKSLTALLQQSTINDHDEILRACNAHSKQAKSDLETQQIRFIALLKLDRYEDALQLLDEAGDRLKQKAVTERAYALYRSGSLQEALDVAKSIQDDRGARHVEAQASYHSEDFANTATIYQGLASKKAGYENEDNDVRINGGATDAQLVWSAQGGASRKKKHAREDLEAFETAYNAGCLAIARGELREGEFLLKTAQGLCASLDDLTESEKTAEILPIKVQQLYLLCQLGKTQEAEALASEITVQEISDASTKQIAQNNLQAASSTIDNPFVSRRLLHSAPPYSKNDHPFKFQSNLLEKNTLTADLLAFKSDAVIKSTEKSLSKDLPSLSSRQNSLSVLNAAAHAQSKLAKLGLKQILPLFSKRPTDIGLAMTIIQLYMLTSNSGAATTVLDSLLKNIASLGNATERDSILYAPGLVALQVSLYGLENRASQTKSTLAKASSYWRHKSKTSDQQPTALLQAAGLGLLESSNPDHQTEAQEVFSSLHSHDPNSSFATAGYVAANALSSPSTVAKEAETLPSVSRLIAGIDLDALEAAGVPTPPSKSTASSGTAPSRKRALQEKPKPARKRRRKSRLPNNYDPAKKADPERWLPLKDRSNYRPKGKKGKKKAEDKTQGGTEKAWEESKGGQKGEGVIVNAPAGGGAKSKGKKKGKR